VASTNKNAASSKSISDLKTAADLTQKLDELKKHRQKLENDWKLNLAFYRNNQYCYVSKAGRLETLPTEEGEKPRYRVRLTANQITPGVQTLLAKLTKTKPVMSATPQSSSTGDVKAAQMSEFLLEDWWVSLGMDDKLEEALLWSIVAGQGWWKISWDEEAGLPMEFTMNPTDGSVITNDALVTQYKNQLQQMGLPEDYSDQTVFLGDVRVDVLSPFQVWVDPAAKTYTEAKYAICEHSMSPDEIKARFGKTIIADAVPTEPDKALKMGEGSADSGSHVKTVKKVYFGYLLPQAALPRGRYVVWVEDGAGDKPGAPADDKQNILYDKPWEFPTNELPLVKFNGVRVPGSIYDDAVVTMARPLQKELNRTISQIVQYKNLTIKPRVWAPVGSLKQRITDEPGAVYEFQPIAGMRPEVENLPSMPPYVFEHLKDVTMRLRDVFGLNEVSEGRVPPNVEAGVAIDLLQEMATDRLAPTIKLIETSLARASKLLLILAQEYYVEPRLLKIRGGGGSMQVKKFKGADIKGGVDVTAESGSGLPRTRAGRQARIDSYVDRGVLQPHQAWKYYDLADMKSVAAKYAADEDQAYREIEKLIKGEPLNMSAVRQAQQALMQGINPSTGQPLQDESEVQQVLEQAAFSPGLMDNDSVHLDVLHDFMVSVEYEALDPEIQRLFELHASLTQEQAKSKAPLPEGQAPRVNFAIKGTAGPTVAAEIANKAGIQVTPEDFMEEPLETWVTDSMDKPDADSAGNDEFTQAEQVMQAQLAMDKHAVSQASTLQKMAHAEQKAAQGEEAHQQAMKTAREKPSGPTKK